MTVSIPPDLQAFVDSLIAKRRFSSESEVLAEGLRLLQAKEALAEAVQEGFQQIDEGAGIDGSTAIAELRTRLASDHRR